MALWLAFTLGLFGSLHCVGMCGPIAMILPLTAKERSQVIFQSTLYHFGRITTYALMGAFMGLMGWGIFLAGYQKAFSIAFGILFVIMALFSFSFERQMMGYTFIQSFFNKVKNKLSSLLSIRNNSSAFKIGLLNGILPCGLVYVALAGSVTGGDVLFGAAYMAAFGLGTLPMMISVMAFKNLHKNFFFRVRKWIPVGLFLFGVLMIYRGIMLDVPLDLKFWEANNFPTMCH
ncbi:MAG: sulfite exporter TauE/SafE family protein [Bacteroidia bacterium]|nr:sulfite exporter TauE/SafE family protein [Bacteroidia bacterium]